MYIYMIIIFDRLKFFIAKRDRVFVASLKTLFYIMVGSHQFCCVSMLALLITLVDIAV